MPRRRIAIACSTLLACAAVCGASLAGPAGAQAPRIGPGVTAGGIDVSGLTVQEAASKIVAQATPALEQDLVLGVAGRPWRLTMADAKLDVNGTRTAERALAAKGPGDVALVLSHSHAAVRAFVEGVARRVRHAPRSARVRITLRHIRLRRSKDGKGLSVTRASRLVDRTLDDAKASRVLHLRLSTIHPKLTTNGARRAYGTVLTVDKAHFRLRLFKRLRFVKSYGVAVGQPAYPTPSGLFHITDKQVNPVWSVPNSPWAGELQGTTVEGGSAANPLKARWMGIVNGVGIHGTGEDWSIGHAASHGCIRMHVGDVIALFKRVPVGTPVLIR
jgi:hypothetical protein